MRATNTTLGLACMGLLGLAGGCNLITGVSKLDVEKPGSSGGRGGEGGDPGTGGSEDGSGGSSAGGSGGSQMGGAPASGGTEMGGFGGELPTDCSSENDCVYADQCLIGACDEGMCAFTLKKCEVGRTCVDGSCECQEGSVDCAGVCTPGVCCPGETQGGCGNCGVVTCNEAGTGFECQGQGACAPSEKCSLTTGFQWSDGSSCSCGALQTATCSSTCEKGACQ